ncbi:MAG: hypothetical protein IJ115_06260 [Erysipelotrichaceae bacterium]|nr:hypothetical protein [Erysipelotrichaceae bacterium]
MTNTYIAHHGILGQKWGVRRFQNPDGSLTEAGKKRLSSNPDKTRNYYQKQVNRQRGKLHGSSNRWMSGTNIGKKSKEVSEKINKERQDWENSEHYKSSIKKMNKLDRDLDAGKINFDEYESKYENLQESMGHPTGGWNAYKVTKKGRRYLTDYPDKNGKDLTKAYLKDLGYNEEAADFIQKIIRKSEKQVLD